MGSADYYKHGDRNAICDECGGKFKLSQLRKRWDKFLVCSKCWEPEPESNYWKPRSEQTRRIEDRPEQEDVYIDPSNPITKDDL